MNIAKKDKRKTRIFVAFYREIPQIQKALPYRCVNSSRVAHFELDPTTHNDKNWH